MSSRIIFALLCLAHLRLLSADELRSDEPKLVQEIRAVLPEGWECRFESGDGTKYVPVGLPKPDFVVIVANPKVVIATFQTPKHGPVEVKPIIPLCFHRIDGKPMVLETITKQRLYSWAIPVYFGETMSHIVVTSPAWVNGGRYSLESKRSIHVPVTLLQTFMPDKEDQSFAKSLLSEREN